MPNASDGGTEDRASQVDARSPGSASETPPTDRLGPGEVRIDSLDQYGNVRITTSYGVVRDQLVETRMESSYGDYPRVTYTFLSGMTLDIGRELRPGMVLNASDFGYTRGGYGPRPGFVRRDDNFGRIVEVQCDCEACRGRRTMEEFGLAGSRTASTARRWVSYTDEYRQREERERFARRQRESLQRSQRMQKAAERAEETLLTILTPAERKEYEKSSKLIVTGSDKRKYMIGAGTVSNVQLMDKTCKRSLASLCCHPSMAPHGDWNEPLPDRDAHIAQILYLRYDLDKFWDTANIYWHDRKAQDEYLKSLTIRRRTAERARDLGNRALDLADDVRDRLGL